jgi:hypothetical protein
MGIEGTNRSAADILSALDRGEIIRGNKGYRDIPLAEYTIQFNPATGHLHFTKDGVITYAQLMGNQVIGVQLTEADTGKPFKDGGLATQRLALLTQLLNQGIFH